jgi:fructoselysine-6-P-deglycase FrlB-like protein
MTYVDDEIASQPDCWRRAAELADASAGALPARGERVAVVGCGTSWFMAMAYAALRERAGHGETDAFQASEFPFTDGGTARDTVPAHSARMSARRYDRVVAITRSGTTTEVLDLLAGAAATGVRTTAVVGDPASPAAATAHSVVMPFADERSVVQTRFATSALALLRAGLGEDMRQAALDAGGAVGAGLPLDPARIEQVTFLGRGWTVGLAQEAALKCREAAQLWTEAYPAMDYRHGPISIAAPGRAVWAFGDVPEGLGDDVARTGASFVHDRGIDPLAALIVAQRFAVAAARHRGLDPDAPRNLTRSVVLDGAVSGPATRP